MKSETLNASWKRLWPEVVHDYKGFSPDEVHHAAVDKAVRLAQLLEGDGFTDMTHEEVNELIDAHSQPLTDEDLTELTKSASEEEEEEGEEEEKKEVGLTLERLGAMVRAAKELQRLAEEWDPDMLRALHFSNAIDGDMSVYKNLLAQKKKQRQQLPITMFLTRTKKPTPVTPTEVTDEPTPVTPAEVTDTTAEAVRVPSDDEEPDDVAPLEEL